MPEELPRVAGVRFRNAGRIFYFHTAGMRLDPGEFVVVVNAAYAGDMGGMYVMGERPAMSGPDAGHAREALAKLGVACLEPVVVAVHRASLCVRRARCITPANACAAGSA